MVPKGSGGVTGSNAVKGRASIVGARVLGGGGGNTGRWEGSREETGTLQSRLVGAQCQPDRVCHFQDWDLNGIGLGFGRVGHAGEWLGVCPTNRRRERLGMGGEWRADQSDRRLSTPAGDRHKEGKGREGDTGGGDCWRAAGITAVRADEFR